jgi:hypothetical protein
MSMADRVAGYGREPITAEELHDATDVAGGADGDEAVGFALDAMVEFWNTAQFELEGEDFEMDGRSFAFGLAIGAVAARLQVDGLLHEVATMLRDLTATANRVEAAASETPRTTDPAEHHEIAVRLRERMEGLTRLADDAEQVLERVVEREGDIIPRYGTRATRGPQ